MTATPTVRPLRLLHGPRTILRRGWLLALPAAIVALIPIAGPTALGGPTTVVIVSGTSMEPTLRSGDLVVARRKSAYRVGAIVAYRVPKGEPAAGSLVIHRIVGGSKNGYTLRGDNRSGDDLWRPTPHEIVGELAVHVPHVGRALVFLRAPLPLAAAAAAFVFFLVAWPARTRSRS